jgi:hypothetical protein
LGNVTSIPKNEFTKNLQSTEEIIKENEYIYEMSLLGRKLENNEESKILNNYCMIYLNTVSVDNKENHFVSTAIFQEESTKKFEENETPLSILLKNPLLMIIFFITGYILYPKLWKKEYFSKRSLERNNDNIYLSYRDNGETLYNYMNYRRGLYACVRSNFS